MALIQGKQIKVNLTGSFTGSFSGDFSGSGANLTDIPASGIVGLNLSQISSGSVSASISPDSGLQVNTNVTAISFTGALFGTASNTVSSSYALTASHTTAISGTDNYLAKFSGTSTLENSLVYDNGTNVGIGTTSPTSLLHVSGSTLINGPLTVQGSPTDLQYTLINNDLDIIQGQAEANNYGTYSRLRLFRASGTIASPTTPSPGTAVGRLEFGAYNSGTSTFIANAKIEASMDATTGADDLPSRLAFFTTPDGGTNMIERMRINNAGLIRIGGTTMNFSDVLNVEAGSIAFQNGFGLRFTNTLGTPYASVYSSNNNTVIKSLGTAVLIKDNSGANDIITALDGGNVGIGTSTPGARLDVNGDSIITGSLQVTNGITGSLLGTASYALNGLSSSYAVSSSYAETASYAPAYLPLTGGTINGDIILNGTASIAFLNVQYESASVIYSSGSNQFGDAIDDTQTLMGTVLVSGSQQITGSLNVSQGITGSLFGTASNAVSSSYALTASLAPSYLPINSPQTTGLTISFIQDRVYGTYSSPETGSDITSDTGSAILGVTNLIIHSSSEAPTLGSDFKKLSGGSNYVAGLNYIYCTYITDGQIIYSINQAT
jgi:hypothetical protein